MSGVSFFSRLCIVPIKPEPSAWELLALLGIQRLHTWGESAIGTCLTSPVVCCNIWHLKVSASFMRGLCRLSTQSKWLRKLCASTSRPTGQFTPAHLHRRCPVHIEQIHSFSLLAEPDKAFDGSFASLAHWALISASVSERTQKSSATQSTHLIVGRESALDARLGDGDCAYAASRRAVARQRMADSPPHKVLGLLSRHARAPVLVAEPSDIPRSRAACK